MSHLPIHVFALVVSLALCGCGGGGGDEEQPGVEDTVAMSVMQDQSGYVVSNGFVSLGTDASVGTIPDAGSTYLEQRGFLTFDLRFFPAGATVVKAELSTTQLAPTGSPYAQVVNVIVDHIIKNGVGLVPTDFNSQPLSTIVTPPLSSDAAPELKTVDVTSQVQDDIAQARPLTTFRLRGQAINPLTAGLNDLVDPVDLARFSSAFGQSYLLITIEMPAP